MTEKSRPLYQGRDWVTSRWSVAEALGALDHVHDLCLYGQEGPEPESRNERFAILQAVYGLTERLIAQCSIAQAESIPAGSATGSFSHLWSCLEVNQSLKAIKEKLTELSDEASREVHGEIALLALDLKASLRRLDQ